MEGCGDFESLSFLESLPRSAAVMDLIYNPSVTKLLAEARRIGHLALNGLGMLIHQGLLAFEHFTGIQTDEEDLLAVQKALVLPL
jgi:shikimate dehydrogenase